MNMVKYNLKIIKSENQTFSQEKVKKKVIICYICLTKN